MRHKHADLIHRWAEGEKIQFFSEQHEWEDIDLPVWDTNVSYRVKPDRKRYRVGLVTTHGKIYNTDTCTVIVSDEVQEARTQMQQNFVRWLDDWQFYDE